MSVSRRRGTWGLAGAVALALAAAALPATAADRAGRPDLPPSAQRQVRAAVTGTNGWASAARLAAREPDEGGESPEEIAEQAEQYAWARTAPALTVPAGALAAARREAAALPVVRSRWRELTRQPLDAEPPGFTDPVWSNAGAGFGLVSGRATAITASRGAVYAGAADGGVWRTTGPCGSAPARRTPTPTRTPARASTGRPTAAARGARSAAPPWTARRSTGWSATVAATSWRPP